jgi:hypothetical protein
LFEQLSDKYSVSTERRREIEMVSNATWKKKKDR